MDERTTENDVNALVLGGTGFVGRVITKYLANTPGVNVTVAARRKVLTDDTEFLQLDGTNTDLLTKSLSDMQVVVNCITGSGDVIRENASAVVEACRNNESRIKIIHMSSMAVYGNQQGHVNESTSVSDDGNWYGKAKIDAENTIGSYGESGGSSTILRIGCVYGPNSALWVDRVGLLLRGGRLGDLGTLGDGWSNLVHVDDIAKAVVLDLSDRSTGTRTYNMSAPDSPRWNDYFKDFSLAIGRTPIKYKTSYAMALESKVIAPPLKALERLASKGLFFPLKIQSMPPSLLRLWCQHIKLDSAKISADLGLEWTPYKDGLQNSIAHFKLTNDQ